MSVDASDHAVTASSTMDGFTVQALEVEKIRAEEAGSRGGKGLKKGTVIAVVVIVVIAAIAVSTALLLIGGGDDDQQGGQGGNPTPAPTFAPGTLLAVRLSGNETVDELEDLFATYGNRNPYQITVAGAVLFNNSILHVPNGANVSLTGEYVPSTDGEEDESPSLNDLRIYLIGSSTEVKMEGLVLQNAPVILENDAGDTFPSTSDLTGPSVELSDIVISNNICPIGWVSSGRSGSEVCYLDTGYSLNYEDAVAACAEDFFGELAQVRTMQDNQVLANTVFRGSPWIDISGGFDNWAPGEEAKVIAKLGEMCPTSSSRQGEPGGGLWRARNCSEFAPVVCMMPMQHFVRGPGIVRSGQLPNAVLLAKFSDLQRALQHGHTLNLDIDLSVGFADPDVVDEEDIARRMLEEEEGSFAAGGFLNVTRQVPGEYVVEISVINGGAGTTIGVGMDSSSSQSFETLSGLGGNVTFQQPSFPGSLIHIHSDNAVNECVDLVTLYDADGQKLIEVDMNEFAECDHLVCLDDPSPCDLGIMQLVNETQAGGYCARLASSDIRDIALDLSETGCSRLVVWRHPQLGEYDKLNLQLDVEEGDPKMFVRMDPEGQEIMVPVGNTPTLDIRHVPQTSVQVFSGTDADATGRKCVSNMKLTRYGRVLTETYMSDLFNCREICEGGGLALPTCFFVGPTAIGTFHVDMTVDPSDGCDALKIITPSPQAGNGGGLCTFTLSQNSTSANLKELVDEKLHSSDSYRTLELRIENGQRLTLNGETLTLEPNRVLRIVGPADRLRGGFQEEVPLLELGTINVPITTAVDFESVTFNQLTFNVDGGSFTSFNSGADYVDSFLNVQGATSELSFLQSGGKWQFQVGSDVPRVEFTNSFFILFQLSFTDIENVYVIVDKDAQEEKANMTNLIVDEIVHFGVQETFNYFAIIMEMITAPEKRTETLDALPYLVEIPAGVEFCIDKGSRIEGRIPMQGFPDPPQTCKVFCTMYSKLCTGFIYEVDTNTCVVVTGDFHDCPEPDDYAEYNLGFFDPSTYEVFNEGANFTVSHRDGPVQLASNWVNIRGTRTCLNDASTWNGAPEPLDIPGIDDVGCATLCERNIDCEAFQVTGGNQCWLYADAKLNACPSGQDNQDIHVRVVSRSFGRFMEILQFWDGKPGSSEATWPRIDRYDESSSRLHINCAFDDDVERLSIVSGAGGTFRETPRFQFFFEQKALPRKVLTAESDTEAACRHTCAKISGCVMYTHYLNYGQCYLYTSDVIPLLFDASICSVPITETSNITTTLLLESTDFLAVEQPSADEVLDELECANIPETGRFFAAVPSISACKTLCLSVGPTNCQTFVYNVDTLACTLETSVSKTAPVCTKEDGIRYKREAVRSTPLRASESTLEQDTYHPLAPCLIDPTVIVSATIAYRNPLDVRADPNRDACVQLCKLDSRCRAARLDAATGTQCDLLTNLVISPNACTAQEQSTIMLSPRYIHETPLPYQFDSLPPITFQPLKVITIDEFRDERGRLTDVPCRESCFATENAPCIGYNSYFATCTLWKSEFYVSENNGVYLDSKIRLNPPTFEKLAEGDVLLGDTEEPRGVVPSLAVCRNLCSLETWCTGFKMLAGLEDSGTSSCTLLRGGPILVDSLDTHSVHEKQSVYVNARFDLRESETQDICVISSKFREIMAISLASSAEFKCDALCFNNGDCGFATWNVETGECLLYEVVDRVGWLDIGCVALGSGVTDPISRDLVAFVSLSLIKDAFVSLDGRGFFTRPMLTSDLMCLIPNPTSPLPTPTPNVATLEECRALCVEEDRLGSCQGIRYSSPSQSCTLFPDLQGIGPCEVATDPEFVKEPGALTQLRNGSCFKEDTPLQVINLNAKSEFFNDLCAVLCKNSLKSGCGAFQVNALGQCQLFGTRTIADVIDDAVTCAGKTATMRVFQQFPKMVPMSPAEQGVCLAHPAAIFAQIGLDFIDCQFLCQIVEGCRAIKHNDDSGLCMLNRNRDITRDCTTNPSQDNEVIYIVDVNEDVRNVTSIASFSSTCLGASGTDPVSFCTKTGTVSCATNTTLEQCREACITTFAGSNGSPCVAHAFKDTDTGPNCILFSSAELDAAGAVNGEEPMHDCAAQGWDFHFQYQSGMYTMTNDGCPQNSLFDIPGTFSSLDCGILCDSLAECKYYQLNATACKLFGLQPYNEDSTQDAITGQVCVDLALPTDDTYSIGIPFDDRQSWFGTPDNVFAEMDGAISFEACRSACSMLEKCNAFVHHGFASQETAGVSIADLRAERLLFWMGTLGAGDMLALAIDTDANALTIVDATRVGPDLLKRTRLEFLERADGSSFQVRFASEPSRCIGVFGATLILKNCDPADALQAWDLNNVARPKTVIGTCLEITDGGLLTTTACTNQARAARLATLPQYMRNENGECFGLASGAAAPCNAVDPEAEVVWTKVFGKVGVNVAQNDAEYFFTIDGGSLAIRRDIQSAHARLVGSCKLTTREKYGNIKLALTDSADVCLSMASSNVVCSGSVTSDIKTSSCASASSWDLLITRGQIAAAGTGSCLGREVLGAATTLDGQQVVGLDGSIDCGLGGAAEDSENYVYTRWRLDDEKGLIFDKVSLIPPDSTTYCLTANSTLCSNDAVVASDKCSKEDSIDLWEKLEVSTVSRQLPTPISVKSFTETPVAEPQNLEAFFKAALYLTESGKKAQVVMSKIRSLEEQTVEFEVLALSAVGSLQNANELINSAVEPTERLGETFEKLEKVTSKADIILKPLELVKYVGNVLKALRLRQVIGNANKQLKKGVSQVNQAIDKISQAGIPISDFQALIVDSLSALQSAPAILKFAVQVLNGLIVSAIVQGQAEIEANLVSILDQMERTLDILLSTIESSVELFETVVGIVEKARSESAKMARLINYVSLGLTPIYILAEKIEPIVDVLTRKVCLPKISFSFPKRCFKIFRKRVCIYLFPKIDFKGKICIGLEEIGNFLVKIENAIRKIPGFGFLYDLLNDTIDKVLRAILPPALSDIRFPSLTINTNFVDQLLNGLEEKRSELSGKIQKFADSIDGGFTNALGALDLDRFDPTDSLSAFLKFLPDLEALDCEPMPECFIGEMPGISTAAAARADDLVAAFRDFSEGIAFPDPLQAGQLLQNAFKLDDGPNVNNLLDNTCDKASTFDIPGMESVASLVGLKAPFQLPTKLAVCQSRVMDQAAKDSAVQFGNMVKNAVGDAPDVFQDLFEFAPEERRTLLRGERDLRKLPFLGQYVCPDVSTNFIDHAVLQPSSLSARLGLAQLSRQAPFSLKENFLPGAQNFARKWFAKIQGKPEPAKVGQDPDPLFDKGFFGVRTVTQLAMYDYRDPEETVVGVHPGIEFTLAAPANHRVSILYAWHQYQIAAVTEAKSAVYQICYTFDPKTKGASVDMLIPRYGKVADRSDSSSGKSTDTYCRDLYRMIDIAEDSTRWMDPKTRTASDDGFSDAAMKKDIWSVYWDPADGDIMGVLVEALFMEEDQYRSSPARKAEFARLFKFFTFRARDIAAHAKLKQDGYLSKFQATIFRNLPSKNTDGDNANSKSNKETALGYLQQLKTTRSSWIVAICQPTHPVQLMFSFVTPYLELEIKVNANDFSLTQLTIYLPAVATIMDLFKYGSDWRAKDPLWFKAYENSLNPKPFGQPELFAFKFGVYFDVTHNAGPQQGIPVNSLLSTSEEFLINLFSG